MFGSMIIKCIITRDDVVSQRLKFGSAFLSFSSESKIALFFLTFPYPATVPKNCVIFIGYNFKSRGSQVGLHKQKKDTASAKKGKVRLQRSSRRTTSKGCALDLTAQDLASGDWKYCLGGPAGRLAAFSLLLIHSQKARMSGIITCEIVARLVSSRPKKERPAR